MSRPICINRTEAELLVDLLENCEQGRDGAYLAQELAAEIRQVFGMVAREQELRG
jgi:hypothetical protein